jgi:hypothetical protein
MSPQTSLDDLMGFSTQKKGGMKKAHATKVGPKKTFDAVHADGRAMQVTLQVSMPLITLLQNAVPFYC